MKLILDGCKLQWHTDRVKRWKSGERIAPITIDCALTTQCNYRCVYCYGNMQLINQCPHLEKDVIMNFLDDAKDIGVKAISFVSDGESTCNPHYVDAILHGNEIGIDMALGTNGYLLNEDSLLKILPALTYLRFNITAGERKRYAEIHGCKESAFDKVCDNIKKAVEIKKANNLDVTIGLQMVFLPEFADQVMPLTKLGKNLGVDYLVIKHCSDDEDGTLGVEYEKYFDYEQLLKDVEAMSTEDYQVSAKWSKLMGHGKKSYSKCYGAPFILQLSGSGLVAPCGFLFNDKYKKYHIGNINNERFKDIFNSDRYWEVMDMIASDPFDTNIDCGTLCLQHKANEYLWDIKNNNKEITVANNLTPPPHINFI